MALQRIHRAWCLPPLAKREALLSPDPGPLKTHTRPRIFGFGTHLPEINKPKAHYRLRFPPIADEVHESVRRISTAHQDKIFPIWRVSPRDPQAEGAYRLRFPPIADEVLERQAAMLRGCHVHAGGKATVARASGDTAWRRRTACEKARRDATRDEALSRRCRAASGHAASSARGLAFGARAQRGTTASGEESQCQAQMTLAGQRFASCYRIEPRRLPRKRGSTGLFRK